MKKQSIITIAMPDLRVTWTGKISRIRFALMWERLYCLCRCWKKIRQLPRKFKVGDFYKHTLLAPGGIEKMLKGKGADLSIFGDVDDIIERKPGNLKLVPDDAKGEAVGGMGAVFKAIAKRAGK